MDAKPAVFFRLYTRSDDAVFSYSGEPKANFVPADSVERPILYSDVPGKIRMRCDAGTLIQETLQEGRHEWIKVSYGVLANGKVRSDNSARPRAKWPVLMVESRSLTARTHRVIAPAVEGPGQPARAWTVQNARVILLRNFSIGSPRRSAVTLSSRERFHPSLREGLRMCKSRIAPMMSIVALLMLGLASAAVAQTPWPTRAVKIITPLPPGTGVDLVARLYAERLGRRWSQPVVVENRVGADGIMATSGFIAAHDDHTLLLSVGAPFTIAPVTTSKLPYDPADITPIAQTAEQILAIGVSNTLGVNTLAELEARARKEPGKIVWGSSTGLPQLSFMSFTQRAGLDMPFLTYRDTGMPLADLGEGRLHIFVSGMAAIRPQVEAGNAKFLALLGPRRYAGSPETPTVAEAGYPSMMVVGITALFGWKGMPVDLRDRIAADVKAIAEDPGLQARLATAGLTLRFEPAHVLVRMLEEQKATVADVLGSAPVRK